MSVLYYYKFYIDRSSSCLCFSLYLKWEMLMDWIFQDRTRCKLGKTELTAKCKRTFPRKNVPHNVVVDQPVSIYVIHTTSSFETTNKNSQKHLRISQKWIFSYCENVWHILNKFKLELWLTIKCIESSWKYHLVASYLLCSQPFTPNNFVKHARVSS